MPPRPLVWATIALLAIPYPLVALNVFLTDEPWWSHEVVKVEPPPKPAASKLIRVSAEGVGGFKTISEAVRVAAAGDRILVERGVYREAVVVAGKPWLSIEGVDPEGVVLDGGGVLGNGIYVVHSPHVTVANLTVRNYAGNGIFFVNSDHFRVYNVRAFNNRVYGLNVLASERGVFSRVVAAGSGDSGLYIGEVTERCECIIEYAEAYNNTLGYSGTRANGVTIRNSRFYNNAIGIAPNTLMPDIRLFVTGRWPLLLQASHITIENNIIEGNNNRWVKAAGFAASYGVPVGVGIALIGTSSTVVRNNTIINHEKWGVAQWYFLLPPTGNIFSGNRFSNNGLDYWSDGWTFGGCSEGEGATGDVPPPCSYPIRLSLPNPLRQLELLLRLEVPGASLAGVILASGLARPPVVGSRRPAGRGRRVAAAVVDALLVGDIYLSFAALLMVLGFGVADLRSLVDGILSLTFLLLPLAYFIATSIWVVYGLALEGVWGQTLGKRLLGLRVAREGVGAGLPRLLARNLLRYVDLLLFGSVGLLSILLTGRSIGDLVAGVRVEEA